MPDWPRAWPLRRSPMYAPSTAPAPQAASAMPSMHAPPASRPDDRRGAGELPPGVVDGGVPGAGADAAHPSGTPGRRPRRRRTAMSEILAIRDLSVAHNGRVEIDRFSLSLNAGETVILLGEADSGKDAVLRLL